ncbi:hypothetical protein [Corynebacterium vitaeruminis]|uniref:Uncharacterized protein n=1 Tax=Corynebacterium vitaeruminis DSM 20294 TaxID=1224164 RepID=W5Y541_9CORY|nr:hypothetical protein [Corynebacterium vitaeruminis]AHI21628.1 hypothetical protein B843_01160 [Corynebacterium vitaeruminis DSM 20294]
MSTPSFKDSFVAVGRETISKERNDYVYSVGVAVTALMVLAGAVYFWTPIASIVVLICAIILMWGRHMILRQVMTDMNQMRASKNLYPKDKNPEYLQFIELRAQQMLRDNRALTPLAKQEISQLLDWARAQNH